MSDTAREGRPSTGAPDSPRAWLVVAAAFVAGFVVFGTVYSFGVFLEPMASEFGSDRAATSALFAITGVAFYLFGSVTGHLSDRFGPRIVVGAGAALMGAGLVLTGFIDRLWVGYVTYGIGLGVGAACVYVPTLAVVGGWFTKRRSTALGVAAAGTGCGTLAIPPLATALIGQYGWRMADIVLGLGAVVLVTIAGLLVAPPPQPQPSGAGHLGGALRSFPFLMLYVSWILATTALFVPFVYLPAFALQHGAGGVAASALLSLLGGMSVIGRIGMGAVADRIGILPLFKMAVFAMAASYVIWLAFDTYASMAVFAAVLGIAYGLRIALMPGVLIEFFGLQNLGALLGIFFTGSGISAACGPLLAGYIADSAGGFRWGIAFALAMGALGFVAIAGLKVKHPPPPPATG